MDTRPLISDNRFQLVTPGLGIRKIHVERLFGQFTYTLEDKISPKGSASRILLLYGDNGSGKTTILKTLFFLLSHVDRKGHKSEVKTLRFRRFEVEFADGTQIVAERKDDHDPQYEMRIQRGGQVVAQALYGVEEARPAGDSSGQEIREYYLREAAQEENHKNLLAVLQSLNLGMIYLTDTRRIFTTLPGAGSPEGDEDFETATRELRTVKRREAGGTGLTFAVRQISSWATRRALKGSAQGEEDVNSVYASIITRLARAPEQHVSDLATVVKALEDHEKRSVEFVRFGLMKPLRVNDIVLALKNMRGEAQTTVLGILAPYIEGVKARLDALEPIRTQLAGFVDTMNSFYRNKEVHLDVNGGMTIRSANGDDLSPNLLSSGEGQLLFLLASTIVAKERSSFFMIDEPEISLNVKWQRQLIKSLLDLTADSNIQFVFATHSIELLTQYSEFVLDLEETQT